MLRYLTFCIRFFSWLTNATGTSHFAEEQLTKLMSKATAAGHKLRAKAAECHIRLKQLKVERAEVAKLPRLSNDEYFSTTKRIRLYFTLAFIAALAEIGLNYISAAIVIPMTGIGWFALRIGMACILTVAAAAFTKLSFVAWEEKDKSRLILFGSLLFFSELAIVAFAFIRAHDVEKSDFGIVSIGFIALACVLPLMVGSLWYEIMKDYDAYRNRFALKRLDAQIAQLSAQITGSIEVERNMLKQLINQAWSLIKEFQVYKENRDRRKRNEIENVHDTLAESKAKLTTRVIAEYAERLGLTADEASSLSSQLPVAAEGVSAPAHANSQVTNVLPVVALFVMSCFGCGTIEHRRVATLVFDISPSISDATLAAHSEAMVNEVIPYLELNDRLIVSVIDGGSRVAPVKLCDIDLSRMDFTHDHDGLAHADDSVRHRLRQYMTERTQDLPERLMALRSERRHFNQKTDIFGALTEVARIHPDTSVMGSVWDDLIEGKPRYRYRHVVLILSDMIHECERYDFSRRYSESYGKQVISELIDTRELPQLATAEIIVHGRTGVNASQVDELLSFWETYFRATGAELLAYEYDARAEMRMVMTK